MDESLKFIIPTINFGRSSSNKNFLSQKIYVINFFKER